MTVLLSLLCFEQHALDPVAVADPDLSIGGPSISDRDHVLVAAALAAGEPQRALHLLSALDDGADVTSAEATASMRYCATVLQHNWFPGDVGGMFDATDVAALNAAQTAEEPFTPVGWLAGRLLPHLLALRFDVTGLAAGEAVDQVAQAVRWFELNAPAGPGRAVAFHATVTADLYRFKGDRWHARQLLSAAAKAAGVDAAALAHLAVVQGDWLATPGSRPELLGLSLHGVPLPVPAPPDLDTAAAFYAQADRSWTLAGSRSGAATLALRQAHLARLRRDTDERDRLRAQAEALAASAGSSALNLLALTHGVLDRLGDGGDADPDWCERVLQWAHTVGSPSYARGLVRLVTARSAVWGAEGSFVTARRGLRLAETLAAGLGAVGEVDAVAAALAQQHAAVHRPAAMVSTVRRLATLLPAVGVEDDDDVLTFTRAAHSTMGAMNAASSGSDVRLVEIATTRLHEVLQRGQRLVVRSSPDDASIVTAQLSMLAQWDVSATALRKWYAGLAQRRAGHPEAAEHTLRSGLEHARASGYRLLECAVLMALRRRDEATDVARALCRDGELPVDQAATLFLRVGSAADAAEALARAGLAIGDKGPGTWQAWSERAQLSLLRNEPAAAVWESEQALRVLAETLYRLGRDVLRTASTDLSEVADSYHAAVLARVGLADVLRASGDPLTALSHEQEALLITDQARGLSVGVVDSMERLNKADRVVARTWLRASAQWSATYEDLAQRLPSDPMLAPSDAGARIAAAERALDDAEEELVRRAPAVLRARLSAPANGAELRRALPEDTVLLAYHSHRDDLVAWSLTKSGLRVERGTLSADDLAGECARAHQALAGRLPTDGLLEPLVETLLAPFADEITGARRVLVVPHSALALLPFHALPWNGKPLGAQRTVSYLPSVGFLGRRQATRPLRLDTGAFLLGDPAVDPARGFRALPGTRLEVLAAAEALEVPDPVFGANATSEAVRQLAPRRGIVHLAAHGVVEPDAPNLSRIVLAGGDLLSVADLVGLDLAADLLVLSACHTGEGSPTAAGDIVGLTRAAVIAGARHAVVSLWPVDDEAATLVMAEFYRSLACHQDVATALARAQNEVAALDSAGRFDAYRALADTYRTLVDVHDGRSAHGVRGPRDVVLPEPDDVDEHHPYYWAPFIHVGV